MQSPFTPNTWRRLCATLGVALVLALTPPPQIAFAEDTDLFVNAAFTQSTRPNILIIIDNSSNWNAANQHWPTPAGETGVFKQGESELRAIRTVLGDLNGNTPQVNMGLMMARTGDNDGGIVRFAIREMNTVNISAFRELLGTPSCADGANSLNGTPNCILKNFSGGSGIEQVNAASIDYSALLFDTYKYFGGYTSPAYAQADVQPPGAINDSTHHGQARYFAGAAATRMDAAAYTVDTLSYASSQATTSACAKNYIIFIGNGMPNQDPAGTLLQNVNGGATPLLPAQLAMQNFTTTTGIQTASLGSDSVCRSASACATAAAATHGTDYDSYSCTGGTTVGSTTNLGTDNVCESNAACVTRAAGIGGATYATYSCTGGSTVTGGTATIASTTCIANTVAACNAQGAIDLPGFASYACTSGVTTRSATATDTSCDTNATCVSTASGYLPGYASYSCGNGTQDAANATGTDSTTVCHDATECSAAAQAAFPAGSGYTAWSCTGGSTTSNPAAVTLSNGAGCHTCPSAGAVAFSTPSGSTASYACSGGSSSGCSTGTLKGRTVTPTFTCTGSGKFGQTMNATGGTCNTTGFARNRLITGSTVTCGGTDRMYTIAGTTSTCGSGSLIGQTMQGSNSCQDGQAITGSKTVVTVTPGTTFCTPGTTGCTSVNYADEWARFLYTTDVSSLPGQQNVATYTIDVFKDQQDADETALLFNMAKWGGGKYFQASNEDSIISALRQILIEIQSVNSVFASASLPINATNRSQNENQVFIGMFRPDGAGNPRWYGNLKRYQIAKFGQDFKLADSQTPPLDAVSTTTGFIQPCAISFWTQDSGGYWFFQNGSAGSCSSAGLSLFSDSPDGPQVEKGAVAEVLRRGNNPPTTAGALAVTVDPTVSPPTAVVGSSSAVTFRNIYTCAGGSLTSAPGACCQSPATCAGSTSAELAVELVRFNATNVSKTQLGNASMTDTERDNIVKFTTGQDIFDDNDSASTTDVKPAIHGDVAHSRPLPVNYGGTTGVVLFYGANDGAFRAVQGSNGKELWAFFASEHHSKLKRLTDNAPPILYSGQLSPPAGAISKDYFFDGSAGLFQNADSSKVWLFPTMRRGGRMIYALDVTAAATPVLKWRLGCSNPDTTDTSSCSAGFTAMGQSWSIPSVALIKGYSTDVNNPLIITGAGYDTCEDQDAAPNTACSSRKGNAVYVINANTGTLLKTFTTLGSVPSDLTLVDRDFDGFADHAYVSDTLGNFYRIDFVDPANPTTTRAAADWTINRVGFTTGANRKFLFAPAVLPSGGNMYITNTTGDRERPLISNYPFASAKGGPVANRAYMLIDDLSVYTDIVSPFTVHGTPVDLDGSDMFDATSTDNGCSQSSATALGKKGWRFDLNNGTGEQGVTSSLIFGGLVFFSTNRPVATPPGACANDLGEARGYAVNLLTASGAVGTEALCGGTRSGVFIGGGLPPSPVTGVVPVDGVPVTVMIGGIQRTGGSSSAIGSQRVKPTISQKRSRIYWYRDGDK